MLDEICPFYPRHIRFATMPELKEHTEKDLYETFCSAQSRALQEVCQRVQEGNEKGEDSLTQLAMELSVEASARRTAAERILTEIALQKEPKESPSAGEGKDHSKEKKREGLISFSFFIIRWKVYSPCQHAAYLPARQLHIPPHP